MPITIDVGINHYIAAANRHFYQTPTEKLYLNRTLQYHDLIYLETGRWLFTEEETDYLLEKGDVLLLCAGHHHYTRLPCETNTRTICIHVSNEENRPNTGQSSNLLNLPSLIHAQNNSIVKEYFENIVRMYWSNDCKKDAKMAAMFQLLMLELSSVQEESPSAQTSLAAQIIELITRMPYHNFHVEEVGHKFSISARTVENCMHRAVGMSFTQYQLSRKLEMAAQQLIVEPDITLSEIARNLGFYDAFHMSKAFKAKYSVSPTQYRNTVQNKQELLSSEASLLYTDDSNLRIKEEDNGST